MFITFVKVSHNIFEPFHFFSYDMLIFIITFPIAEGNEKKTHCLKSLVSYLLNSQLPSIFRFFPRPLLHQLAGHSCEKGNINFGLISQMRCMSQWVYLTVHTKEQT